MAKHDLPCFQWFLNTGPRTSGNVWRHFWLSQWGWREVLLASGRQRPEMLLNILQCTGQPLQQRIIQPQTLCGGLGNPALGAWGFECSSLLFLAILCDFRQVICTIWASASSFVKWGLQFYDFLMSWALGELKFSVTGVIPDTLMLPKL